MELEDSVLRQTGQRYKDKCHVLYSCAKTKNADLREERLVISKEQKQRKDQITGPKI